MHVLIDKANLTLHAKHPDMTVLENLAFLRMLTCHIEACNHVDFLKGYTDYELKMLYKNITGEEPEHYRAKLVAVISELVSRMKVFECNPTELEYQANNIAWDDEEIYDYRTGSPFAMPVEELFKGHNLTRSLRENDFAIMGIAKTIETIYPNSLIKSVVVSKHVTQVVKAESPKRGTGREIIWSVANDIWEKHNKPTNIKELLAIRREIMTELENNYNVKRTTSSNELGKWQATLLA